MDSPAQDAGQRADDTAGGAGRGIPAANAPGASPAAAAQARPEGLPPLPPEALLLVPVRDLVLMPGTVVPIAVGRPQSVAAAQEAVRGERQVGVVLQRDVEADALRPEDLHGVGTAASILRYVTTPDGTHHIVCQGQQRFRIVRFYEGYPFLAAEVVRLEDYALAADAKAIEARLIELKQRAAQALALLPEAPPQLAQAVAGITSASALADFVTGLLDLKPQEKQAILETIDVRQRLDRVLEALADRIGVLKLSREISERTRERIDERNREAMLREQLRTIQRQLGEGDQPSVEIDALREAIVKAGMPPDVESHAMRELARLERMPEAAGEYGMARTYLEWLTELPWSRQTDDRIDIAEARRVLDEDHFGLDKVKRRILEHLAVRKLAPEGRSPILCFVGPPGVGKTSLGQSIARAMNRQFARVSLGGVHDEAEIRGHRRTYIGAMPGNILQAIRKAGSRNCVMVLDEIDKLGSGIHGDPSAALLEVLDPAQNATFRDNYLGVPFDLSRVMFIATANMLDTVPGPLRDRMEVIHLPGYTEDEKAQIARRYLLPRQLEANGLRADQLEIDDAALRAIVHGYTREAGVRNLEREIGAVLRHAAMRVAEGSAQSVRVTAADLEGILGPVRFESEVAARAGMPGVATGLAWTPAGGDILFVEATRTPGSGRLILTGQLGDVMKESAQTALTLVKAHSPELQVPAEVFEKSDIHVHVPAGAIPKDGPSAGVAMFIALASLAMGRSVRNDVAMTGEVSLRGLVLPVGGIREKVLAALQAEIRTVLLPARNRKDLQDVPDNARSRLQFVWLETVDDALRAALAPPA